MTTLTAEYALCTVAHLAERHGSPSAARRTAKCTGGPVDHRSDVFNERRKPGLVQSRRG